MIATWNDKYSVGVDKFDNQHKKLFDIINEIGDQVSRGEKSDAIKENAKQLRDYTVLHFGAEERVMNQHNYPGFEAQKEEHEKFRLITRELYTNLTLDKEENLDQKLKFLATWLFEHIGKADKQYQEYFDKEGIVVN